MNIKHKLQRFIFTIFLLSFVLLFFTGQTQARPEAPDNAVWIIPIRGDIMPSLAAFVRRETRKALNSGVGTIIFEIDTFGGRVDSTLQITSFIMSIRNAKTVAWIGSSEATMGISWSAGAIIAFACSEIYMAPGSSIGAAAPVSGAGESAGEKAVAAIRSQVAALAERNGHPVGLALAMVDYDIELWEVRVGDETRAMTLTELERLERDRRDSGP